MSHSYDNAGDAPSRVVTLAEQVERDGGRVLSLYREPVNGHWQLFCLIPTGNVAPTPYQRDLSPTHAKRLTEVVKRLGRFVDPLVVVSPEPSVYWTPNGNHRRAVAEKLKLTLLPAVLIPEVDVAYEILALNTEKAHNLKEKSLEVVRMYRGLAASQPRRSERDFAAQFEAPHFVTLGVLYDENKRFAGGAFAPILKRVDRFLDETFSKSLKTREERAEKVRDADVALAAVVAKLKKRGLNHPFVKSYVLARATPLTRQRKTVPSFDQTLRKLAANLETFDVESVRVDDVRRSALIASVATD
jgi:ParB family chromosome partitioning protein